MADENEVQVEEAPSGKGGSKKLLIIIAVAVILLGGGGFAGYKIFLGADKKQEEKHPKEETVVVPLDPFVLNLSNNRYLKFTVHLELSSKEHEKLVTEKIPLLRDAIIMLMSNKSSQSLASPEGKARAKEEILSRINEVMGSEGKICKNIYFTEFVMQ